MKFTHKIKVAIVASVASLAIAGAAFAYFTTTGAGIGVTAPSAPAPPGAVTARLPPTCCTRERRLPVTFTVDNPSDWPPVRERRSHLVSITTPDVGPPCAAS